MQTAIVGLAGSGKTTVFNTLTRGHAETGGYGGVTLNVGVVKVPDDRLDRLAEIFKPKKIVQADVTYVDLPAPPPSTEGHVGTEELPADHLARLRDSDALLHVVRAFEDPAHPHPDGSVDPARDLERLDLEFILADLSMTERRLERLSGSGRHGTPGRARVERARGGHPAAAPRGARGGQADPRRRARRRRGEGDPRVPLPHPEARPGAAQRRGGRPRRRGRSRSAAVAAGYDHRHAMVDALSARIEMELGELEPDEAAVFMEELGIAESGLDRVIALTYRLLGLISFLTAGPDEVRAWPIPDGSNAVDAAAAIHTDLAKGFIRAETVVLRRPAVARLDGRGAQGRPAALGREDLPDARRRRRRDPVQQVGIAGAARGSLGRRSVTPPDDGPSSGGRPDRSRPGPSGSRSRRDRPRSRPRRGRPARRPGPPRGRPGSCPRPRSRR